ncbi:YegJ family protein [Aliiroseovarius sp.]|uniref:YegJ family protein n=1 Tax=Aliiroseovarius sp. TaxID=1872442 RepID=UPI003BAC86DB
MRRAALSAGLILSLLAAPLWAADPTVDFLPDDPRMTRAEAEAGGTLDKFLAHALNEHGLGYPNANLKVAFATPELGTKAAEVIWVARIRRDGDGFSGELANEPAALPGLHLGDRVPFSRDQIRDWGWKDHITGKLFGHYTTRVIVLELPAAQAAPVLEILSDTPVPSHW